VRQRLPSVEEQKRILKKKGINIGRARTKGSVYRLYNYYITQKHPKSTPRIYAYAMEKRLLQRIDSAPEPDKVEVRTGTGRKVPVRNFIRRMDRESQKEFERSLPPNMSFQYGKRFRTVDKVRDFGVYEILPPIKANLVTVDHARKRAQQVVDELITIIHIAQWRRGRFYKNYDVGGRIIAEGHNFDIRDGPQNPPIVVSLPWTGLYKDDWLFQKSFMAEGFENVFKTLFGYSEKASVTITRVELKFSTDRRPSNVDRLRSR